MNISVSLVNNTSNESPPTKRETTLISSDTNSDIVINSEVSNSEKCAVILPNTPYNSSGISLTIDRESLYIPTIEEIKDFALDILSGYTRDDFDSGELRGIVDEINKWVTNIINKNINSLSISYKSTVITSIERLTKTSGKLWTMSKIDMLKK